MKTEKFMVPWNDGEEEVEIKKMGWGAKQDYTESIIETEVIGSRVRVRPKLFEAKKLAMKRCLLKAPFPFKGTEGKNYIDNELDEDLGELIYGKIDVLNGLDLSKKVKEAESLESTSSTEQDTVQEKDKSQST